MILVAIRIIFTIQVSNLNTVRIRRAWTALQKLAVNIIIKTPENPPSKIISKNSKIQNKKRTTNN